MNVVFLSPHFPSHYYHFCSQLKAAGATVLGIGDAPYAELEPQVQGALIEYYRVADMHNYDALVRACGFFTHKYGKLERFESLNEYWLDTEARIRDDFNIFGLRGPDVATVRRKSLMKARFQAAGVPVAPGRVVRSHDEARKLIAEIGYPVVAKPDAGVGALNTYRLNQEADLHAFFNTRPKEDYILEAFVQGRIYSFDGLCGRDGEVLFCTSHVFSQGIMETVNEARHISYYSLRQIPATLERLGRQCLQAFGVRERFFHIEFFRTAEDTYVGLEVNMRPPGGYTTDMFNYACDIDVYRLWAQLLTEGGVALDYTRKYHCCYASRKHQRAYRHSHEEIMTRFGAAIMQVASVPGVFSSALGDIGYIFRSAQLEVIEEIINFIHAAPGE
jgi:hypothetical protein